MPLVLSKFYYIKYSTYCILCYTVGWVLKIVLNLSWYCIKAKPHNTVYGLKLEVPTFGWDFTILSDQCVSDHVKGKKHRHLVNLKVTREEQAEKSVFVGNLQKTTSELELMDYFSQYGPISKVVMDKQKVSTIIR